MAIQKCYSVNFGSRKSGLATVGYTLPLSTRTAVGVAEAVPGSGIYSATISHDEAFAGPLVWDTGETPPVYAVEDINPTYLAPSGLDSILVEAESANGMRVTLPQSLSVISAVLAGRTVTDPTSNTITFYAMGNPNVARLSSLGASNDRQVVSPNLR